MNAFVALMLLAPSWNLSVETDPAFWVGTASHGAAVDVNVDVTLAVVPRLRFGVLAWSGRWQGAFARAAVLPASFREADWAVRWSGAGLEAQYQLWRRHGRGGLSPGLRVQWNHFDFDRGGPRLAQADHFVLTPQVGYQWFPFTDRGVYLLPWVGVQLPLLGTRSVATAEGQRDSRKILPVATVHVGWTF